MGFFSGIKALRSAVADPEAAAEAERARIADSLDAEVVSYLGPLHASGLYQRTIEAAFMPAGTAMSRRSERKRTDGVTDWRAGRVAYLVLGPDGQLHLYSVLFGRDGSVRPDQAPTSWRLGEVGVAIDRAGGATTVTLERPGQPALHLELISLFRFTHLTVDRFARDLGIAIGNHRHH